MTKTMPAMRNVALESVSISLAAGPSGSRVVCGARDDHGEEHGESHGDEGDEEGEHSEDEGPHDEEPAEEHN